MNTKKSCKFAILTLISGIMSGCASNHTLIQRSEIAFENIKTNEVYFCKCGMGPVVYNVWIKEGVENNVKIRYFHSIQLCQQKNGHWNKILIRTRSSLRTKNINKKRPKSLFF
jgi:hypothetical protein